MRIVVNLDGTVISRENTGGTMSREEAQSRYSEWWARRLIEFIAKQKGVERA